MTPGERVAAQAIAAYPGTIEFPKSLALGIATYVDRAIAADRRAAIRALRKHLDPLGSRARNRYGLVVALNALTARGRGKAAKR